MVDFTQFQIQTFPAINDSPVAPTNTKAGNGSHVIKQHNDLASAVAGFLSTLSNQVNDVQYNFQFTSTTVTQHSNSLQALQAQITNINNAIQEINSRLNVLIDSDGDNGSNTSEDDMASWIVKNANYNAVEKDKIILQDGGAGAITIVIPIPSASGTWIQLINQNASAYIDWNGAKYQGESQQNRITQIDSFYQQITLIYIDQATGWIPSNPTGISSFNPG